jgi:hypothetical protein
MKKYGFITTLSLMLLLSATACNHSAGQQTFSNFTSGTFSMSADESPVDVESINLIFDVENDESVFDQVVMGGEFSV